MRQRGGDSDERSEGIFECGRGVRDCRISNCETRVPIVKWIEHGPPEAEIEVRILVGAQFITWNITQRNTII